MQPTTSSDPPSIQPPISLDLSSVQPPTSSDPPLVQSSTSLDPPLVQPPTSSDPPSVQPPTSSNPPLVQSSTYSDPLSVQLPTSSDPLSVFATPYVDPFSLHLNASLATPLGPEFSISVLLSPKPSISITMPMQINTSTLLDLPPAISRVRQGLRRPRLLPPPLPLFLAPTPSQTDILYVSHAVLTTVREERPKRKRVPVTHSFSPCGGI